jgi:hypothetical protein
MGDVLGADDALLASRFHAGAAQAGEGGAGNSGLEFGDDGGAVEVTGGLAGGEEDARVGDGGDASSLPSCAGNRASCGYDGRGSKTLDEQQEWI